MIGTNTLKGTMFGGPTYTNQLRAQGVDGRGESILHRASKTAIGADTTRRRQAVANYARIHACTVVGFDYHQQLMLRVHE